MKLNKKFVAPLAALLLVPAFLVACNNSATPSNTPTLCIDESLFDNPTDHSIKMYEGCFYKVYFGDSADEANRSMDLTNGPTVYSSFHMYITYTGDTNNDFQGSVQKLVCSNFKMSGESINIPEVIMNVTNKEPGASGSGALGFVVDSSSSLDLSSISEITGDISIAQLDFRS